MNIEKTETKITQNQTKVQTENLQQQELQTQDQNPTTTQNQITNESTLPTNTTTRSFNSTNVKLTQSNEEQYQLLIKELKLNEVEIGEQEKPLVQKAYVAFLEEMELLKKDRDERLQELRNWFEYNVHNLKKSCSFEKKQAKDEFEVDKGYLKQHILLDLQKKETKFQQMIQNQQKKQLKSQQPPKNVYQEFLKKLNKQKYDRSVEIEPELKRIEELLMKKKRPLTKEEIQEDISIIHSATFVCQNSTMIKSDQNNQENIFN
ncbi:breast cancer metastasis-suppressor 1 [Anaeramoeba flamelloides]|uniref:Breast cancer metastasis-suppressor 1 n=1 Tax=Anaeramoeba flamelloides TaxID=1746091 RepID=A0ABQ8Z526_9EUKA|nr:breast cancer metastasis-suppressor 1 [Anaeramoeba flamelloides]